VFERGTRGPLAGFAAFGTFWGGWAVLVPTVQTAVHASKGALGLALLGIGLGSLPAMLVVGRFIDRALRRLLPLSFLALGLVSLLPAFAGSVEALGAFLIVVGACSGVVDVSINAEVAAIEAESGKRLMQLAHGLFSVGVIVGAVAGGLLRQAGAGRIGVLAVLAAAQLVAALANRNRPQHAAHASAERPRRRRFRLTLFALGAACAAAFMVESGIENWSALFLQRDLGAGDAVSAAGPASYATAMAAGRLTSQWVIGRLGDRLLLGGGALLSAAGLLVASGSQTVPGAAIAFFLGGCGVSVAAPILFSAAGRGADEHDRASSVAMITTIGYMGFLIGPPLVGGIAQAVGLRASFVVLAGVAAVLAAATPWLALPRLRPAEAL
jgi:predicted MFS family arabinose efflux permease